MAKSNLILKSRGQSIIETVVGIIFLIPIVLLLFDVAVLVIVNTANDNLAKAACRAAASATKTDGTADGNQAYQAAKDICNHFASSTLVKPPPASADGYLKYMCWNSSVAGIPTVTKGTPPGDGITNPPAGQVVVVTHVQVTPPVPILLGPQTVIFRSQAIEPIVSLPP